MPRQRAYCREQVTEKAMKVFWNQGYEGTSVQDLVEATGINRFSMYEEFGDKEGLFQAALDKYRDIMAERVFEPLERNTTGLGSIKTFFDNAVETYTAKGKMNACLITNTTLELAKRDTKAAAQVKRHLDRMERGFLRTSAVARGKKEIHRAADLEKLSKYLVGVAQGLAVISTVYPERKRLKSYVHIALSNLQAKEGPIRKKKR